MQVLVVTVSSYGKVFCHMSEGLKKSNEAKLLVDELSGSLHKIQVAPFLSGTHSLNGKQHQEPSNVQYKLQSSTMWNFLSSSTMDYDKAHRAGRAIFSLKDR